MECFAIGRNVTIKKIVLARDGMNHQAPWEYVIAPEDGTPNDFGIFNRHELNPTAAYIAMGRDGYKSLTGLHLAMMWWDHETSSPEPSENELRAVHIRNPITNEHGWYLHLKFYFTCNFIIQTNFNYHRCS